MTTFRLTFIMVAWVFLAPSVHAAQFGTYASRQINEDNIIVQGNCDIQISAERAGDVFTGKRKQRSNVARLQQAAPDSMTISTATDQFLSSQSVSPTESGIGSADFRWAYAGSEPDLSGLQDATKITYFKPSGNGLRLGVSLTPDPRDNAKVCINGVNRSFDSRIGLGAKYVVEFEGANVAIAAVGSFANTQRDVAGGATSVWNKDLTALTVGFNVGMQNFTVDGSYSVGGDDGAMPGAINDDYEAWSIGVGYSTGPFTSSVVYSKANLNTSTSSRDNVRDLVALGLTYSPTPNVVVFGNLYYAEGDVAFADDTDNGTALLVFGTRLNF